MVCAVRQLGELRRDGHCIGGSVEITRNLDALDCLQLPVEYQSDRIAGLDVVFDDQLDLAIAPARHKRDVARLQGRLQSAWVGRCILLGQVPDLLTVVFELGCFLLDNMLQGGRVIDEDSDDDSVTAIRSPLLAKFVCWLRDM